MTELRPNETIATLPDGTDAGIYFIGRISTPWTQRSDCPRQGNVENGPLCRIAVDERWRDALEGVKPGDRMQVLYWMHEARRDLTRQSRKTEMTPRGTFALRSPNRPNPIASSIVVVAEVDGLVLKVRGLDCLDGTALVDIKPEYCPHGLRDDDHHHHAR